MLAQIPFRVQETHGILTRPQNQAQVSSDSCQWTSLYASAQREQPYEGRFPAVPDQLLVLHRSGPVALERLEGHRPRCVTVPAGGVHLYPGGSPFGVRLMGELDTLHVYIRRAVLEEVAAEMIDGDPANLEIPPDIIAPEPVLGGMLAGIAHTLGDTDYASAIYIDHLARAIAAQLVRRHSTASLRQDSQAGLGPDLTRATAYMRDNLHRSISLDDLGRAVGRSPSHLARQFRETFGRPPHSYLIDLRLDRARHLLEKSHDPIAGIAVDCGFSHQEHLTRFFRRRYQTTPAAYRRSRQN